MSRLLSEEISEVAPLVLFWDEQRGLWDSRPEDGAPAPLVAIYGTLLASWWRTSPAAVLECSVCGEIRLTGKKTTKSCGCSPSGRLEPLGLEDAFTKKRPRGRKVSLPTKEG